MSTTAFETLLRDDILSEDIVTDQRKLQIIVETQYKNILKDASCFERLRSHGKAKNITEVMELIVNAVNDYHERENATQDAKVRITYEHPDAVMGRDEDTDLEVISLSLVRREPGAFSQGGTFQGRVKNKQPILREEIDDPEHPGYKKAILGYFYDNLLRMTCWARTNKQANARALWLEEVMTQYAWYFQFHGVPRMLYEGRAKEELKNVNGNKIYGRPIDYFVRTEKLRMVSMKELELIIVRMAANRSSS